MADEDEHGMEDEAPQSHTSALSFKDRILNRRIRGRGKRVKEDTAAEAPIVFPKLKLRKLDETGELVVLWLLSVAVSLIGGLALVASPLVGGSLLSVGVAGFLAYLLGCRWAKVQIPPGS